MKKSLFAITCAFSLCLISCASKPENAAPQIQNQEELPQTDKTDETSDTIEQSEEKINSSALPEPDFFEEPEIITLEPVEEQPVETSEPTAELVEPEKDNSTEVDSAQTEALINQNDLESGENQDIADKSNFNKNEVLSSNQNDSSSQLPQTTETNESETNVTIQANSQNSIVTDNPASDNSIIDITDDSENEEETKGQNNKSQKIIPSRTVTLKKFEYLDVTYPGRGWIYMGLTDNSKDIAYFGRKLGTKDTKFTLQARNGGTKIVHFYKNDALTGQYLDDYLEVIVLSETGSNKTHIAAPEYKLPVQKKETPETIKTEGETESAPAESKIDIKETPLNNQKEASSKTQTDSTTEQKSQTTKSVIKANQNKTESQNSENQVSQIHEPAEQEKTVTSDSATLLKEAQLLYNEKEYPAALSKINQFLEVAAEKRDEAFYLKGQILEAKSNIRDIKGAIEAYSSLTKNYPASKLWDNANKRIIYLKRFYLEVR